MDEMEMELTDADLRRSTREYVWFAITLLCIMGLVVFRLHN
jgi:hypothetical protein